MGALIDDENNLWFDTAWSAPLPIIKKLAEMFPSLIIIHKWADEDYGSNTGHTEYESGNGTYENIPDNCSVEAYALYEECWDCKLDSAAD